MAGMKFEYDESGTTFYYFLLAFYVLILIPCTYYFWPKKSRKTEGTDKKQPCHCEPCQKKRHQLKRTSPWKRRRRHLLQLLFIILWIGFALLVYKVSTIRMEWNDFDPFSVLNIDKGADLSEIKRAYRQLSLKHHPDKGGDPVAFQRISKAYRSLTNEQDRKNLEEYGNPDGPGATHFGIALPKWLVKSENSLIVLGVYTLIFMFVLPIVVGVWWNNASKFTGESVLLDSTQLYQYFLHKTPSMMANRIIMILTAAFEFDRGHNAEMIDRPSDNVEIPQLLKLLSQVNEKKKEMPFGAPYSVKARTIFYAHLHRLELNPATLELNRHIIIAKCPLLIQEMVSIAGEFTKFAKYQEDSKFNHPTLDTIEHIMKLSPFIVQALNFNKSPLLQLPHLTEDSLRHFVSRKRSIKSIKQLVQMEDADRRALLRSLTDEEYRDLLAVCSSMPFITMAVNSEVIDDSGSHITANSLVTVTVRLIREQLSVTSSSQNHAESESVKNTDDLLMNGNLQEEAETEVIANGSAKTTKIWEKQHKKKKGKSRGKGGQPHQNVKSTAKSNITSIAAKEPSNDGDKHEDTDVNQIVPAVGNDDEVNNDDSAVVSTTDIADDGNQSAGEDSEEDEGWHRLQAEFKKENSLDTKPKTTHVVHCPYFPAEKLEYWWIYICDRKFHTLVTVPLQITSLIDEEEVQLKFSAPKQKGIYQYTVCFRSDSYLDMEMNQTLKLEVHDAPVVEEAPRQWDFSDGEDGASNSDSAGEDSDSDGTDYDLSS